MIASRISFLAVVGALTISFLPSRSSAAGLLSVDFNLTGSITQSGFSPFDVAAGGSTTQPFNIYTGIVDPSISSGQVRVTIANGSDYTTLSNNTGNVIGRDRSAPANSGAFTYGALYRDLIIASNFNDPAAGTLQLQLTQLNPNTTYGFTFYIYDNNSGNSGTETVVNRTNGGSTTLGSVTYVSGAAFTSNSQYSLSTTATSDSTGKLLFSFTNTGDSLQAILNGFELTAVPEPGSWGLLVGLGLFGVVIFRRTFRRCV